VVAERCERAIELGGDSCDTFVSIVAACRQVTDRKQHTFQRMQRGDRVAAHSYTYAPREARSQHHRCRKNGHDHQT
jgi:hypothetical protein